MNAKWYVSATLCLGAFAALCVSPARAGDEAHRCRLWLDLYRGEPIPYEAIVADLATARVVYLGEHHTIAEHHDLQARLIADLGKQGAALAIGLEQLDAAQQPIVARYNRKEISFDQLAEATQWAQRWPNFRQYQPALEATRGQGAPLVALNARSEIIRRIARGGGVAKLDPASRRELPAEMRLDDPLYEKLLAMQMMVHLAATPQRVRPMVEAQIARDETMAATIAQFLQSEPGRGRTMIVLCGAGHVAYGLGTPERVRRLAPGIKDRIVLFSESGDLELSTQEKAMSREISITHEQLRAMNRPIADYLHAKDLSPARE
jgi:uncharacterized iron-regulated protein